MLRRLVRLIVEDRAAESALPLLVAVQMAPKFAEAEVIVFGSLQFVDRWAWVGAMLLYAAWLWHVAPLRDWQRHMLVAIGALAATVLPAERALAMPIIGLLQGALLVALWQWWDDSRGQPGLAPWFLGVTLALHGIGATMLFAVCQLAMPAGLLMAPGAGMVCNVALGPWAMIAMLGVALLSWGALAKIAICRERRDE